MMARDPVCGMSVDVTTAYAEAVGGETYYFCSEACRQRFDENPNGFGAGARQGSGAGDSGLERHEPPRTTKGGITAPKFGSAGSGGAELEPLPEQHDDDDTDKH
jgi:YHS domain-containing protein